MIEQAVQNLLQGATAVTNLVGNHIHIAERPQRYALPTIVISRGSKQRLQSLQGPVGTESGFVRVATLASTYLAAADIAEAVKGALDGHKGSVSILNHKDQSIPLKVKYLIHDSQDDLPSEHRDGEGRIATHGITIDFRFAIKTPTPTE